MGLLQPERTLHKQYYRHVERTEYFISMRKENLWKINRRWI